MDTDFSTQTVHRLERLHHWLTFGGSSSVLLLAVFLIPYSVVLSAMLMVVAIFTPYMLWMLYQTGHRSWITAFAVMVMLPAIMSLMPVGGLMLGWFLQTLALILFFLYCWALRHSVGEWVEKIRWHQKVDA